MKHRDRLSVSSTEVFFVRLSNIYMYQIVDNIREEGLYHRIRYSDFSSYGVVVLKICYDYPGNVPNKGRNFNTHNFGKMYLMLFVWLAVLGFRQNYFYILPNFGDFGAKMSFFSLYIINQKRNNFIKHCSPHVPRSRWYQRCVST